MSSCKMLIYYLAKLDLGSTPKIDQIIVVNVRFHWQVQAHKSVKMHFIKRTCKRTFD